MNWYNIIVRFKVHPRPFQILSQRHLLPTKMSKPHFLLEIGISKDKHTLKPDFVLETGLFKDKHRLKAHFLLEIGIFKDKARPEVALVLETVVFQDKLSSVTSAGERAHIN